MIHKNNKCVFVHITKTAGSSISKALGANDNGNPHRNIFDYRQMMSDKDFNEYFKFAVVRNPWERMVSEWHYQQQRKDGRHTNMGFGQYLRFGHINQVGNQLDWIAGPRWQWHNGKRTYIHKSDDVNLLVDKVIRFENLEEGIAEVAEELGITIDLPKLNTSKHSDYQEHYNDTTEALVARMHERDINYFNYTFDG